MKTVICSTGTSAAKKVCKPSELLEWVSVNGGPEKASQRILDTFSDVKPEGRALRDDLSAEIHSLVRIGLSTGDRVLFLASDTDDGNACALAVQKYLHKNWPTTEAEVKKVEGLQVRDAHQFRKNGVRQFIRLCLHEINKRGPDNVVLNPTGGFKALVPYTVLIGMLRRASCKYIFEQSETLIELPPVPIEFQRSSVDVLLPLFERMHRETSIPLADWEKAVPYNQRSSVEALVEIGGNEVTISDIGFLFLEDLRNPLELVPFVSQKALQECLQMGRDLQSRSPLDFLQQVGRSAPKGRIADKYLHIKNSNGTFWLKPGNTTDRYLASIEDWRLLVWRAIREDQLGPDYSKKITLDPMKDRPKYAPFFLLEYHS